MHLGLIGGIGPAATEYYYRGLVRRHPADASSPLELTIAHADMNTLLRNLAAGASEAQAGVFRTHLEQLAAAGVQVAAITSIAGHFCIDELERISPLPVLNAVTVLRSELTDRGVFRVGLLGSKAAMETRLYGGLSGIEAVLPAADDLPAVGDAYLAMAAAQRATEAQRKLFFSVGAGLCAEQGAEVVVLAGTDMFLAFDGAAPGFPTLDSAEVHVAALSRASLQENAGR